MCHTKLAPFQNNANNSPTIIEEGNGDNEAIAFTLNDTEEQKKIKKVKNQ